MYFDGMRTSPCPEQSCYSAIAADFEGEAESVLCCFKVV